MDLTWVPPYLLLEDLNPSGSCPACARVQPTLLLPPPGIYLASVRECGQRGQVYRVMTREISLLWRGCLGLGWASAEGFGDIAGVFVWGQNHRSHLPRVSPVETYQELSRLRTYVCLPTPSLLRLDPSSCFCEINISLEASARLALSGTARQQPESQLGSREEQDLLK